MIISTSFLEIQHEQKKILELNQYADYMHYDIMDGIFTTNKTPLLTNINISKPKDVHLMVTDVQKYVDIYTKINPTYITFHLEVPNTIDNINYIKQKNIKVGIAINPETPVERLIPYLKQIDLVLVMSVKPGKGGQKFIDISKKLLWLNEYRKNNNLNYLIEVDGGINNQTIKQVKIADIIVVGSYITSSHNYDKQIKTLRGENMQKGFTLAELMGVTVILGIIATITFVIIDRSIKNSRYETCLAQEKNIIEGAKTWAIDHPKDLPHAGLTKNISITELKTNAYIEEELKSPMTNEIYSENTNISIYATTEDSYEYTVTYGNPNKENCSK